MAVVYFTRTNLTNIPPQEKLQPSRKEPETDSSAGDAPPVNGHRRNGTREERDPANKEVSYHVDWYSVSHASEANDAETANAGNYEGNAHQGFSTAVALASSSP
jgi:hypothetical protein